MKGHITGWSRFLGVEALTVMVVVIVGVWSLSMAPPPGAEVLDTIAESLRGGDDCFTTTNTNKCDNLIANTYCDDDDKLQCKVVAKFYGLTGTSPNGVKHDPDSLVCCGASPTACIAVNTKTVKCGTTGIAVE
jgi:hypothetical protein